MNKTIRVHHLYAIIYLQGSLHVRFYALVYLAPCAYAYIIRMSSYISKTNHMYHLYALIYLQGSAHIPFVCPNVFLRHSTYTICMP